MEAPVSSEAEEYLETIYRLEKKTGSAKTMELARQLKVVPGSITNTIEGLERRGLVTHEPYRGVKLTEKGRKLALNVLKRHRLAERLLTDILHLDWSEAHDAACKLEHVIADESIMKPLEKTLGHPKTCPHGNPMPSESGEIVEEESEPLMKLQPCEKGIIVKVTEEKPEVLRHLATLSLVPGATVEMKGRELSRGPIIVKVMESSHALDHDIASIIWVKKSNFKR
ncbi:MAG: metal-dependent transcriptional regulator [Candidatus Bathyarchaeota archaeon]|nr:metal-dependent transcriptional regulator [Candidatus Bathyarchaeota archaeon]